MYANNMINPGCRTAEPATDLRLIVSAREYFETDQPRIAEQKMSEFYVSHKLQSEIGITPFRLRHERLTMQFIDIGAVSYASETLVQSAPFEEFYLIQMALRSTSEVRQNGVTSRLAPGAVYVFNPQHPVEQRFHAGFLQLNLRIAKAQLETFLGRELGHRLIRPLEFYPATQCNDEEQALIGFVGYLCSETETLLKSPQSAKLMGQMAQMLMTMLLSGIPHTYRDAYLGDKAGPFPYYLRKAIDFIETNKTEEIAIADLAVAAGVSVSCLFLAFRNYLGITPIAYLTKRRLERAHELLLQASARGKSVTEIATDCGFQHLSRFSSAYKNCFGELPSQTLRRG